VSVFPLTAVLGISMVVMRTAQDGLNGHYGFIAPVNFFFSFLALVMCDFAMHGFVDIKGWVLPRIACSLTIGAMLAGVVVWGSFGWAVVFGFGEARWRPFAPIVLLLCPVFIALEAWNLRVALKAGEPTRTERRLRHSRNMVALFSVVNMIAFGDVTTNRFYTLGSVVGQTASLMLSFLLPLFVGFSVFLCRSAIPLAGLPAWFPTSLEELTTRAQPETNQKICSEISAYPSYSSCEITMQ